MKPKDYRDVLELLKEMALEKADSAFDLFYDTKSEDDPKAILISDLNQIIKDLWDYPVKKGMKG